MIKLVRQIFPTRGKKRKVSQTEVEKQFCVAGFLRLAQWISPALHLQKSTKGEKEKTRKWGRNEKGKEGVDE